MKRVLWTLVLLLTTATLSRPAWSSCGSRPSILPNEGSDGVPSNTRIWVKDPVSAGAVHDGDEDWIYPSLWTDEGALVETTISAPAEWMLVLTPIEPLVEGATYQVRPGDSIAFKDPVVFSISAGADKEVPQMPSLQVGEVHHSREDHEFLEAHYALLEIEGDADGQFIWLDVNGYAEFDPLAFEGEVSDLFVAGVDVPFVGQDPCGRTNWPEADRGATGELRVATGDLAGNLSEWTDPVTVHLGCGCSSLSSQPSWLIFILLPLLGGRSRRRQAIGSY